MTIGDVQATDAEVIMEGKRSLGFGIVTFPSANQLDRALSDMDGFEVRAHSFDTAMFSMLRLLTDGPSVYAGGRQREGPTAR